MRRIPVSGPSIGERERLYVAAEKHNLPLFFSTHGHADVMASVARAHQGLTMVIDHLGVSQSPGP